jgi:DNA polymerase-3 subunit delta
VEAQVDAPPIPRLGSGAVASALKAVAMADADVKGAADDAAYALERAVLSVSRLRH